jgi:hypothetical protein
LTNLPKKCRHFSGLANNVCDLGHNYNLLFLSKKLNLPCLERGMKHLGNGATCCDLSMFTALELEEQYAELQSKLDEHFATLRSGTCPQCGKPSEPMKQVGACIYAACGHRIGQGNLSEFREGGAE